MLEKFNSFIEKWMAFVTPACLLTGVLFPDIAKHGVPYVTYAFAFMTFIGALKSRFRDVADVFKRPLPLILMLLILHVLGPVAACGLGHLLFPGNMNYITGMVLEFSVPAAVISLMWVSIYNGNSPLSLSLVVIDTILAPFLIPAVLKLLVGSSVKMDTVGMMKELVFMIALPAVLAMCLNEVSHGKVMEIWPKKLAPFSKMCLIFVVTSNSSKVSPYMKHLNGERLEVAAAILVLAAGGYAIGWIIAILTSQNTAATVSMIYGSGMRNISAGSSPDSRKGRRSMEFQHELIIPNEGFPFKLFLFEGRNGNYVREKHWHTSIEIFAVMEGSLYFYIDEKEYPLKAGEFLIINSNEVHSIQAPVRNETIVLQIPLKQFSDYFTAQRFIRFRSRNEESEETDRRMVSLIREMYRVYVSGETGYEFRIRAVFYEVLYLMVSAYRETEVEENALKISRRLDALSKITTYMREHYKEDLRLSGLAAMFGYSDAYLSRMFRKYAKVNFKTYLQDIRMAYAYKELLHTDHTISSIALDNGFASSRAFSREFVKRYGILPGRVERQNHKNVKKVL